MKLFITGATGFIGKHLVGKLVAAGHDVTINLRKDKPSPFEDDLAIYRLRMKPAQEDIDWMKGQKFDGVIHLASLYITKHTPEQVTELVDSNVLFGAYVLECATQSEIPWFVNTGTFWQHYEDQAYEPVNLYSATKQAFESVAQFYVDTNAIKFVSLHLSDTFGENDTRSKIFNIWQNIAQTRETLNMSLGEQLIDISYIDDVVSAFMLLAEHLSNNTAEIANGDTFAVKAKDRYSLKELAKVFEEATGKQLSINWGALPYREREVMVPWQEGKTVPGWKQQNELFENIRNTFK